MRHFKIIPHVADLRLKIEADTLENLFRASLEGMGKIIKKNLPKVRKKFTLQLPITIKSADKTALLIDFLSEVLTLSHIHNVSFSDIQFKKLSQTELSTTVTGQKVNSFDEDIKAVTYHEVEVKRNRAGNYETVIVFDI